MAKTTWADAAKGDDVVIDGKTYRVCKAKPKGKRVAVTLERAGREFKSEVRAKDRVKLVREPLHDREGRQNRWATEREAAKGPKRRKGLALGDAAQTEPPVPPSGDPWETPRDRIEKKLDKILGAHLVAEGDDAVGYYVPPVDVTTIASHMALMHPNTYDAAKDEATMLAGHAHEHRMVLDGKAKLGVNHWHTETRPEAAS